MNLNDSTINPPAFSSDTQVGMTLLDYFAGQAISPMLVQAYGQTPDVLARKAYSIAVAMLQERENQLADSTPPTDPNAY